MKFIELFAGIGGFRYGLENIKLGNGTSQQTLYNERQGVPGIAKTSRTTSTTFTCVWANEIDKYACQIYRRNYGRATNAMELGGCRQAKNELETTMPNTISKSYKRQSTNSNVGWDERSKLYEGDITKVKATDIPYHDLLIAGFPCQSFSIAGKRGGFQDTRGTLFFEIVRIAQEKQPRLLLLENVKGLLSHEKGRTFGIILQTLDELGYDLQWQVLNSKNFGVPQNRERVFIIGHLRGTGRPEVFPIGESSKNSSISATPICRCHKATYPKNLNGTYINTDMRIRRLTPTECERLQGFPDGWTEYGLEKYRWKTLKSYKEEGLREVAISDTQRYKCLGNAVTTNVITEIGKRFGNENSI